MRKIKEVLRLKWESGLSNRQIAKACGIVRPTVSEYLWRMAEAGLSWLLPQDLDNARLEELFSRPHQWSCRLGWHHIHQELRHRHIGGSRQSEIRGQQGPPLRA
ncbi:winged helix-turn-helix transcriptional regulator [Vreelandella utahensis]|uniref:winged helix-turn-helix transcriptional regulator n=1 Tax=Vreelandella halophila TaxID=86177 RepID=UPI003BF58158